MAALGWFALFACGARTGLEPFDDSNPIGESGSSVGGSASLGGRAAMGGRAPVGGRAAMGGRAPMGGVGGVLLGGFGGAGGVAGAGGVGGVGGAPARLELDCPTGPGDPRLPVLKLGVPTALDGARFVKGRVKTWHWTLVPEDCDSIVADPEFVLQGGETPSLMFQAVRPSNYRFTLRVVGEAGDRGACKFEVPTDGRGMRVELCWDTSQDTDLDLYLHNPSDQAPWFTPSAVEVADGINGSTCNVANCTANLRLGLPRADFGFADSPAAFCQAGPASAEFAGLGRCPNPREGEDNNQSLAIGTAERIQLDAPREGQNFRVMVQNFSNAPAEPHLFVYCGGKRIAKASPPKLPPAFVADNPGAFGTMWRAVDITTHAPSAGKTTCTVTLPAPPGGQAPYVTINDPTY